MDAVFYFNFLHQVYNFENGSHTVKTSIEFSKNSGKNSRRLLYFRASASMKCLISIFFQKYIILRMVLSEDKYRVLMQFKEK